jgi:hypothetical protein
MSLRDAADTYDFVSVWDASGLTRLADLGGNPHVVGLSVGEVGVAADGWPDLVVSSRAFAELGHLTNLGDGVAGPHFDVYSPDALTWISLGATGMAPSNEATAGVTDLDNDGDDDVCHPFQADGTFRVHLGGVVDESAAKPAINPAPLAPAFVAAGGEIEFRFDVAVDPAQVAWGAPTHLELVVLRRDGPEEPVQVVPIHAERIDLDDWDLMLGPVRHFECSVPLGVAPQPDGCTHFEPLFFAILRMVRVEGTTVTECHAARLYGFEGLNGTANAAFLDEHDGDGEPDLLIDHDCPVHPGDLSELGGAGDELPCLPGPTNGGPPVVGGG